MEWNAVYLHHLLFHLLYLLHPSLGTRKKQRLFLLKWYNQRKQTNKGTLECLQTNNSMNYMVEFSYIQVNYLPVWKTKEVLWKHWLKWGWGSNGSVPFIKVLCLVSSGNPRAALSERILGDDEMFSNDKHLKCGKCDGGTNFYFDFIHLSSHRWQGATIPDSIALVISLLQTTK